MQKHPIDGSKSIADQRNTLRFIELAIPCKLLTYTKMASGPGSTQKVNTAIFEEVGIGEEVPDLILIAIEPTQNALSVITDQLASGKHVVFHERVFVEGIEKEVLGFR